MWLWQRHGFEQKLLDALQGQQRSSLFCDTLLQAEGISVPAHSCVLAALSPALAQVLCRGPAPPPGRTRLLELQAVGAGPLLRLVGFLYSGRLQGDGPAEREQLLQAAASLGIQGLLEEAEEEEGGRRGEGEGGRRGEGEEGGTDMGTQTDCADADTRVHISPKRPHPVVMTSPSLPAPGHAAGLPDAPLRPPAGQLPCATMPSEGSDDYFSLSSSAAPGLAGVSPTKRAAAPADVAMETANCGTGQLAVRTVALSDDVTAAPPMGCASALAALAPGPGYAARVRPGFIPPAESHSPADTGSRGGAVLDARRGAARRCAGDKPGKRRQRGSRSLGDSHVLIPGPIEDGKVGRMRSSRMRGRGQGRGRAGTLHARQRDCRISIKIRLRRQCKGQLWEIVSRREEGVASTPRGGNSIGRGRGLRHRQNLPTLGRIIRSKDGLPVVKRPRRLSRALPLPQRIFGALTLSPPSALSSPPTLTPLSPPHKPVPLLQTSPARDSAAAVPLPPAPPIAEDSDEQIGKLLDDIMMGLNILPPIIVERDAGRNLEPSGACAYPCPRTPESPRPGSGLLCPRTQDGSPPINCQSGYNGSQETTFPRLNQQASDEMCMLDHFLWSRDSHVGGAWERSAPGHSDGGGAVPAGDQTGAGRHGHESYSFAPQPSVAPATGTMRQGGPAAPARRTAVTLGPGQASSLSPWTELRIPQFLSPPPPITPSLDELRLPARLSPLMEAAPPKNAAGSSALPKIPTASPPPASGPRPPQPLPSWLCPFPVPLHDLPTPLHCALQVPSCPCPPQSQRGPRCSRKGAAEGRWTRAEEEEGTSMRKTATRGPSLEDRRWRKGWKEEEGKKPKPAAPCRTMQKTGPRSVGRGRGGARRAPTVSICSASLNPNMNPGRAGVCAAKLRNGCVRKTQRPAGCVGNPRQTDCADELKRSAIGANRIDRSTVCADRTDRSTVCADRIDRSTVCADRIDRSTVCADRIDRSTVCADRIDRSTVCADRIDRSTVCADNVQKPSVCTDGVKQEGVCLTVKPPLTCADGQQRAAASPRPEPPPKRGRGRPRKRPIEKEATGGPTSILAPDGSGQMGEHGHKPASKRRRMTMPSRLETSLRTQRSRACWEGEPGTPSAIAQLSSIHGEEQRIHGEEEMAQGDGERREEEIKRIGGLMEGMVIVQQGEMGLDGVMEMEERRDVMVDPKPHKNSTGECVEQEAKENSGRQGRSSGGGRLGDNSEELEGVQVQATPTAEGVQVQATPTAEKEVGQATPSIQWEESQAMPSIQREGSQATPSIQWEGSQATPTVQWEESQAMPSIQREGSQATPSIQWEESQATPSIQREESQATPSIQWEGSQATPSIQWEGSQATPTVQWEESQATPSIQREESQATPSIQWEGSQATPSIQREESQATPSIQWEGSQATPTVQREGVQATPTVQRGEVQATPTIAVALTDVVRHGENDRNDVISADSASTRSEDGEEEMSMGEGEAAHTERREPDGVRVESGVENDRLMGQTGPREGEEVGRERESEGEERGGERESEGEERGGEREGEGEERGGERESEGEERGGEREMEGEKVGGEREMEGEEAGGERESEGEERGAERESEGEESGGEREIEGEERGGERESEGAERGAEREMEGEEAGAEADLRRDEEDGPDTSQAGGTPHTQQPSCTGLQRRDLTAATTWNQTVDRSTGSWDQDEEEVEVDVLACSSPAPPAVSLLLEITGAGLYGTGAGLCIQGAGLCDTGPSEEEEGEVDVIGEAD